MAFERKDKAWMTNQFVAAITAIATLLSIGYGMVRYDNTIAKMTDLSVVKTNLNNRISTLRSMLLLKISSDLSRSLTQRIWTIESEYRNIDTPSNVMRELHDLKEDLVKVEEERKYWSSKVRGGNGDN